MSFQQTTLDLYGVLAREDDGVLFYPVFNDSILAAYMYNATTKNFYYVLQNEQKLDPKKTLLFGQNAFEDSISKTIYVAPSLRGTLAAYEELGTDYPVVGSVFSFIGLRRQLTHQKEFLDKFKKVILIAQCPEDEEDYKKDFSDFDYVVF